MVKVQDEGMITSAEMVRESLAYGDQQTERSDESEVVRDIGDGLSRSGTTVLSMYIESTTSRWYWTRESGMEKLLFRIPRMARSAFIKVFWDGMLVH